MEANFPMGANRIVGLADPIAATDAATKEYVDNPSTVPATVTAAIAAAIAAIPANYPIISGMVILCGQIKCPPIPTRCPRN